ncbi:MAG: hypothetical protein IJP89_09100 [Synergistaceae bacterium]|nr:hypothetical protein [Synergistaceae bacterium]
MPSDMSRNSRKTDGAYQARLRLPLNVKGDARTQRHSMTQQNVHENT